MASTLGNATISTINTLLGKLSDPDPDFRFMSLDDLNQILTNHRADLLHNDFSAASRVVDAVIKALDDQNGEVQNLALRWYAMLHVWVYGALNASLRFYD